MKKVKMQKEMKKTQEMITEESKCSHAATYLKKGFACCGEGDS